MNKVIIEGYLNSEKRLTRIYNEQVEEYDGLINGINIEFDNQIGDLKQDIEDNESNWKYQYFIQKGCVENMEADFYCDDYEDKYNETISVNNSNEQAIEELEKEKEEQKKELVKPQEPTL